MFHRMNVRSFLWFSKPDFTFYLHVVEMACEVKPRKLSTSDIGGPVSSEPQTYPYLAKRQYSRQRLV